MLDSHVSAEKSFPRQKSMWEPFYGGPRGSYDSFHGQGEPSKNELVKAYDDIVYACVSMIASQIATSPIRLYVRTATGQRRPKCATHPVAFRNINIRQKHLGQHVEEVMEHPLLELVRKCNPFHNKLDFAELTQMYLDLTGNGYWLLHCNRLDIPEELYLLPSQQMSPERDENNFIKCWRFGFGINQKTYSPKEVIHFRYNNPMDPYGEGVGPLRGAWGRVQVGRKELSYLDNTLSNMGRPDTVIAIKDSINPFEAERLAKEWYQRYQGHGAGGPLVVDGTMNVEPIAYPPKDLAELQLYQVIKTTVSNCFHIPPELWELGQSNRATADTARYLFALNCLKPRLERIAYTLNDRLIPYFDERFFFAFDNVVPEDEQYELQKIQTLLTQQVITRDEARQHYGFDSQEWAREPLLPSGVMPADAFRAEEPDQDEPAEAPAPLLDEQGGGTSDAATSLRATVGGSQQIASLQQAVISGSLTRDMALANARLVFGFSASEVEFLFPLDTPVRQPQAQPEAPQTLNIKCGGEGGKPGPCPEPGSDQKPPAKPSRVSDLHPHAQEQLRAAAASLGKSGMPREKQSEYINAVHASLSRMSPTALGRVKAHTKEYTFYPDLKTLTADRQAKYPGMTATLKPGQLLGGGYNTRTQELALDGGAKIVGGEYQTPAGLYAHEFGHAIDGPRHEISGSAEWQDAFKTELAEGQLSKYAATKPQEGFAEFSRLFHSGQMTKDEVSAKYPKCAAVWTSKGIW